VALKKPSDFFEEKKKTPLDEVKEEYISASPEKIEKVSEAFDAFKSNLNHIQSLSDFTSTFDSFKSNLEKVENVSVEINEIKSEIKDLIKKEDLDSAMMAQLLFVEQSISKIESKVSSINGKTIDGIREDFTKLSSTVNGFLSFDVPKYKKLIAESEVKTDNRFTTFKKGVEENLGAIRADVDKEVTTALTEVQSINENVVSELKEDFKAVTEDINKTVDYLIDEELPKYRKFFAETEVKTEEKINSAIHSYKSTIENLSERVKEFTEEEIPKYSNLLIETKLKSEEEVKELEEEVLSRVKVLSEKVESLSEDVEKKTFERVDYLQDVVKEYKEEIESISKRYETLQKDFTGRVVHEDKKLSQYSKKLDKFSKRFSFIEETLTEDVRELKENLETNTSKFYTELKSEIDGVGQNIAQTVKDLEVNIVINETHLKKQNEYIGNIQEEVKEVLDKLQLDVLEKKNAQLVERINHVEEVFSKINEKTLLTEDNPTLPGDPSTNNSNDPLTPLDQKFVTLDQLQNHYRTFINRIQQQIATIGGGGETRLEFLDDVDRDSAKVDGKFLKYQSSTGKWVGADASGGASEEASKLVLDARNNNVGYAITIGTPVYQTGYNSGQDRINIEEARASDSSTMPAKGVTTTDLANNTNGQILVYGELEGVDTSDFEVADELYVAPSGGLTNVRPTDVNHLVQKIAVVLKKSNNGAILVYGAGRTNDVPNTISIGGSITAGEFYGDGANITGISTTNITDYGVGLGGGGGSQTLDETLGLGNTSSTGMSVGVVTATTFVGNVTGTATTAAGLSGSPDITVGSVTATSGEFSGNVTIGGTLTYEDVTNIDSVGLVTARTGVDVLAGGINVIGITTISTGIGTVHIGTGSTALLVQGDARVTGILTIGTGSITLDPSAKKIEGVDEIIIGTGTTVRIHQDTSGEIAFSDREGKQVSIGIGTTASINTTGIITATEFHGDGSNVTGISTLNITNYGVGLGGGGGGISSVADDTSPQLGGNLDLNSNDITGTGNLDITGIVTATSFVKSSNSGGFLKADGTEDTNTYLTSFTETNDLSSAVTWANVPDTNITESSVTQHQAALSITESQISDLQSYLTSYTETQTLDDVLGLGNTSDIGLSVGVVTSTSFVKDGGTSSQFLKADGSVDSSTYLTSYTETNDLSSAVTWANVPDTNITESSVTQHQAALSITESQISDLQSYLTSYTETQTLDDVLGLGNTSDTGLSVGVVTATSFVGDGSQLSNIISGVGIQSSSTRIGTGFTDINFTGVGITVVGSGTTVTVDIPSSTITRQTETSSGVTTDFTITGGYTVGLIDVYLNGVKQRSGVDFTASDGSTVTMTPFISDGDVVEFQKYDKLNIAGITSADFATNAYNIVGGVSFATSAGIATALNSDSSINTSGIITASQLAVSGLSTSKNLLVTGITSATNIIEIKSNDSTPGRIDLYCETNNAHYARLQAPEHGDFGGNITVKLPASTGTLLLSDGSGASLTSLNASNLGSGTIPDARFPATLPAISGQNLTGIVTGITAGSNITVLESPSGNFIITATGGGGGEGGDTVTINATATDILSVSSGDISADDAGADKLVFWDDSESKLTYLTAGNGLSIDGTTISATGSGGISGIEIEDSETSVGTGITAINFSTNLTATASGGIATVTASGGGGSSGVEIENNGTSVGTGITAINFSTNVTATASGGIATVTASGGGGGGSDGPSSVMMGMIF